tara:strand:+ start:363 stop:548 length:186 start_codon:yes stop_codon:yes gene_type:complete
MKKVKYKRKKLDAAYKSIMAIKNSVPKIIFKTKNMVVTLKTKSQLDKWLRLYPEGTFIINQ